MEILSLFLHGLCFILCVVSPDWSEEMNPVVSNRFKGPTLISFFFILVFSNILMAQDDSSTLHDVLQIRRVYLQWQMY